ncbi:MAG: hypothetical protein J5680_07855 [Neisseriaceae bacterium]|nr:hypothetical protein [Neisseriaceae bacterium]
MKLKLISGAVAPAVCAALAIALSQQAGATKQPDTQRSEQPVSQQQQAKPIFNAEQQRQIDQMTNEIMQGKTPTNPNLTPEQRQKIEKMTQDIKNGKSLLTPEQQEKANKMTQDIMNGKVNPNLTPEQQKKVQQMTDDIMNGRGNSMLTPEQQRQADQMTQQLINNNNNDKSGGLLQGDERLACEATMCLMASPEHRHKSYCKKSIAKYLAIRHKKWHKTVEARRDFLKKCPSDDEDKNKRIEQIVNNDYPDCSAAGLNKTFYWRGNRDTFTGEWSESGVKFVPSMVAQRCGAAWTSWAEYKCDEKQVPVWEEDDRGYSRQAYEWVKDANGKLVKKAKMRTIKTNCRFVDKD